MVDLRLAKLSEVQNTRETVGSSKHEVKFCLVFEVVSDFHCHRVCPFHKSRCGCSRLEVISECKCVVLFPATTSFRRMNTAHFFPVAPVRVIQN